MVFSPSTLFSTSSVQEFAAAACPKGASNPGNSVVLNVVPLTPDHATKEAVIAWPISVICAGVFCAAAVRIVGFRSAGSAVLQRRFSGAASDKFQRFGCGQPPASGIVESTE